ncbi:MAG TPA: hypothetical protein PLB00_08980 [Pseudomonadota bacterium]|nr:hypothetical protein [Pseudomonadota bacterium]
MIETRVVRTLDVSAASGLVLRDGCFHVVADDENALFVFDRDAATRRIALLPGDLPEQHAQRKESKPDFEMLVDLPGHGLLAMGSGSRATRERAVLIDRDERATVIDMSMLFAALREAFPGLNMEGAALLGNEFVLLQRGNRSDCRNALVFIARRDLQRALVSQRFVVTRAPRIVNLTLGMERDVPWSGTDLCVLDDGDLLVSAVLEYTGDAYEDGRCLGSSLARLTSDGTLRWQRRLDTMAKVEGVAAGDDQVWLVSDADDRTIPSQLLWASLR